MHAWVCLRAVRVKEVLAPLEWIVVPGQKVLEDGARVVEIGCPTSPFANPTKRPAQDHCEILASTTAERVSAIWPWVYSNVKQIVTETLKE